MVRMVEISVYRSWNKQESERGEMGCARMPTDKDRQENIAWFIEYWIEWLIERWVKQWIRRGTNRRTRTKGGRWVVQTDMMMMPNMTNTGKVMIPVPIAARNSDVGGKRCRVVEKNGQLLGKRNIAIEAGDCWCDMWRIKAIVEKWWMGHALNIRNTRREVRSKRGHRGA